MTTKLSQAIGMLVLLSISGGLLALFVWLGPVGVLCLLALVMVPLAVFAQFIDPPCKR